MTEHSTKRMKDEVGRLMQLAKLCRLEETLKDAMMRAARRRSAPYEEIEKA